MTEGRGVFPDRLRVGADLYIIGLLCSRVIRRIGLTLPNRVKLLGVRSMCRP